jgi:hypothetical protein
MEIFYSKWKLIKAILLGLMLTSAGIFVSAKCYSILFLTTRSVEASYSFRDTVVPFLVMIISIFGILMFGGMTIVFISWFFHSEPQMIITSDGIEDKRLNAGFIEWSEITFISLDENKHGQWLNINLKSPEKFYRRLSKFQLFLRKANGQKDIDDLRIRFALLETAIDEAWDFIENNVIKPREEKNISDESFLNLGLQE